jgi:hypothetical protein
VLLAHPSELAGWRGRSVAGALGRDREEGWSPVIQNGATSRRCSRPGRIRDVVWPVEPGSVESGHDLEVMTARSSDLLSAPVRPGIPAV